MGDKEEKSGRPLWLMLAAFTSAFALSQAFRTLPAIIVGQVGPEFAVSAQGLGLFAGAFSIAFGALQLFVGIGLDRFGPKRTLCALFAVAVAGALVSAAAPNLIVLILGQLLIGIGCAPAYISTLVFIVRRFPPRRFAGLSGITMSLGSLGMLATATPLAFVVERAGWRAAFVVLAAATVVSWTACALLIDERPGDRAEGESLREAFTAVGSLLRLPQTAGILSLGCILYGAFLTVRSPWIVPLFIDRYGFSLVAAGNVVLAFSIALLIGPLVFGRLDPGSRARRWAIIATSFAVAALLLIMGASKNAPAIDWVSAICLGILSGYGVLQYADVRSSYPRHVAGRAMSLLNTAMFFGVALVQWFAGIVATIAAAHNAAPTTWVFFTLAALLAAGTLGYALLPWPKEFDPAPADG